MATDNKKVSGYLPQSIFDVFEDFREKRSLSASSALIAILSEYFQVDRKIEQSSLPFNNNFVSMDRLESLENKLSELSGSLLSELDRIVDEKIGRFQHELLYGSLKLVEAEVIEVNDELLCESVSSSQKSIEVQSVNVESEPQEDSNHLQLDLIDTVVNKEDIEVDIQSSQTTSEQSDFVLSEPSNSLSGQRLAKRLNIITTMLSTKKQKLLEQDFYNWLQENDPNKISWRPIGGDLKKRVSGWIPAEDTPSELLSRLNEWLMANPE
jgi:hypothetical protein